MRGRIVTARADLPAWVGQRQVSYRFTLIDGSTGGPVAQVFPLRGATLSHDTGGSLYKRTVSLSFTATDTALIDPALHRVRIDMLVDGRVWPLGRYCFTSPTWQRFSGGQALLDAQLADEMVLLDSELERPFAVVPVATSAPGLLGGAQAGATAERLLSGYPVTTRIDPSSVEISNAWQTGSTVATVLHDIATLGGYLPPWFDHAGRLRMIRDFEPATVPPDIDLDVGNRVLRGSVQESNEIADAPNRVLVISNGVSSDEAPVYGSYDVPPDAPHSFERTGVRRVRKFDLQLASAFQADAVAASLGRRATGYQYVELSTPPDPRHDSYQVVRWAGTSWLETKWSLPLTAGGEMKHTLRRAYGD